MMQWRSKFATTLTILSGRSYTEQGGYPWRQSDRNRGDKFILNEALDNSETGVDFTWGLGQTPQLALSLLPGTIIQIDSEYMLVTSVSGLTATVTRGYTGGGAAAAHNTGSTISVVLTGDGAIDMTGVSWCSVIIPSAWTAANLCAFCCATRDGTFVPMRDDVGVILQITTIATAASASYYVPGKVNAGGPYVKFRSITAGTDPTSAVTQAADRVLTVVGGE